MSAYDEKDAAEDTDVDEKEVAEAWHAARETARDTDESSDWDKK